MQLKRQPRDANRTIAFELFDPDRVEVTPRSNVIRKDDEGDRFALGHHFKTTPSKLQGFLPRPLTMRWHNGLRSPRQDWVRGGIEYG